MQQELIPLISKDIESLLCSITTPTSPSRLYEHLCGISKISLISETYWAKYNSSDVTFDEFNKIFGQHLKTFKIIHITSKGIFHYYLHAQVYNQTYSYKIDDLRERIIDIIQFAGNPLYWSIIFKHLKGTRQIPEISKHFNVYSFGITRNEFKYVFSQCISDGFIKKQSRNNGRETKQSRYTLTDEGKKHQSISRKTSATLDLICGYCILLFTAFNRSTVAFNDMANYLLNGIKNNIYAPPELSKILQGEDSTYLLKIVTRLAQKKCLLIQGEQENTTIRIDHYGYKMIAILENQHMASDKYADLLRMLRLLSKTVKYSLFSPVRKKRYKTDIKQIRKVSQTPKPVACSQCPNCAKFADMSCPGPVRTIDRAGRTVIQCIGHYMQKKSMLDSQ